jgi:transcription termination factor NusB
MKIKLKITEDTLKLLSMLRIENDEESDSVSILSEYRLGSHLLEDMAMILGKDKDAIDNTDDNPDGRTYPKEIEEYMLSLHKYIKENLYYFENLIQQYILNGKILKPGTYQANSEDLIFEKV